MPDVLPGTTLPIYPGFGQAPNMLACIPIGLDKGQFNGYNNKHLVSVEKLIGVQLNVSSYVYDM